MEITRRKWRASTFAGALSLGLIAAIALPGCGAMKAHAARTRVIDEAVTNHTYRADLDTVWAEAKGLLFDEGYLVQNESMGREYMLTTDWQEISANAHSGSMSGNKERSRYMVRGIKGENGVRIVFQRKKEQYSGMDGSWSEFGSGRDTNMEYRLISRVEPDRATEIDAKAERAAAQARTD